MSNAPHASVALRGPATPPVWSTPLIEPLLRTSLSGRQMDLGVRPPVTNAFAHPNGFAKIALGVCLRSSVRLFLHVWTDDFSDSDIHNHRWHFASTVIHGRLTNRQFTVRSADGPGLIRCRYTPAPEGTRFLLVPVDTADVVALQRSCSTLEQGDSYSQVSADFHIAHSSTRTVTLMARGQPVPTSATMLLRADDERLGTSCVRSLVTLTADEVGERIKQVLSWVT
jgi:hypothetical protein